MTIETRYWLARSFRPLGWTFLLIGAVMLLVSFVFPGPLHVKTRAASVFCLCWYGFQVSIGLLSIFWPSCKACRGLVSIGSREVRRIRADFPQRVYLAGQCSKCGRWVWPNAVSQKAGPNYVLRDRGPKS